MKYQARYLAYCKFMGVEPEMMASLDGCNHPYMKWVAYQSKAFELITGLTVSLNQDAFTDFLLNLRN